MEQLPDAELVALAKQGKGLAWNVLVERYSSALVAYLRRLIRSDAEAHDLAQDTWVRAFTGLKSLDEPSSVRSWLYRIATHVALASLRRARPARRFGEDEAENLVGAEPEPLELLEKEELRRDVRDCLKGVPPDQRVVLSMRVVLSLDWKTIAEEKGIPLQTAFSRWRLGLEHLRKCLESKGYGQNR